MDSYQMLDAETPKARQTRPRLFNGFDVTVGVFAGNRMQRLYMVWLCSDPEEIDRCREKEA